MRVSIKKPYRPRNRIAALEAFFPSQLNGSKEVIVDGKGKSENPEAIIPKGGLLDLIQGGITCPKLHKYGFFPNEIQFSPYIQHPMSSDIKSMNLHVRS